MKKNQHTSDQEEYSGQEKMLDRSITEEAYLIEVLNCVSEVIIPDDYYEKNEYLIRNIVDGLHDRHSRQGDMDPKLAGKVLETVFDSIRKFGLR